MSPIGNEPCVLNEYLIFQGLDCERKRLNVVVDTSTSDRLLIHDMSRLSMDSSRILSRRKAVKGGHYAMLYYTYHTMLYYTILYYTILYYTIYYTLHYTMLFYYYTRLDYSII